MRKHNPRHLRIWIPHPRSIDKLAELGAQKEMTHIPTFWRALWYLVLLAGLTLVSVVYMITWSRGASFKDIKGSIIWSSSSSSHPIPINTTDIDSDIPPNTHPIAHLISLATHHSKKLTSNQIHTLPQAAAQYRKLRGRHPPPGFKAWYSYASSHNAVINEKFWDQIYLDLDPFWSISPVTLRKQGHVYSPRIEIRGGKVEIVGERGADGKLGKWVDMFTTLASEKGVNLPDIDVPLNPGDEVALLVPWESIDSAVSLGRKIMLEPPDVVGSFSGLEGIEQLTEGFEWKPEWLGPRRTHPASHLGPRPLWSLVRPACPPRSPARLGKVWNDIWDPEGSAKAEHEPAALLPTDLPEGSVKGYVKSWSSVTDVSEKPELQGLLGAFVSPVDMGVSTLLFPLFSSTKLSMSNEILLPDWPSSSSPSPSPIPWDEQENKLHWRSPSTPAHEPEHYWRRFQAERLVAMLNATHVEIAEASIHTGNESSVGVGYARNFRLLPANEYRLEAQTRGGLAEWVNSWADAGFTELECAGSQMEGEEGCETYFSIQAEDEGGEGNKARFGVALESKELLEQVVSAKVVFRSGVQKKWYDTRLVPWVHYVPLSDSLTELNGLMQYFTGSKVDPSAQEFSHTIGEVQEHKHHFKEPENANEHEHEEESGKEGLLWPPLEKRSGHEDAARRIAEEGMEWIEKVCRREDIMIYVYRLILEWARVVDDKRDRLGWVEDLK